jgi:hypothetical protein
MLELTFWRRHGAIFCSGPTHDPQLMLEQAELLSGDKYAIHGSHTGVESRVHFCNPHINPNHEALWLASLAEFSVRRISACHRSR